MSPFFFRKFERWPLEGAKSISVCCEKCRNTNDHIIMVDPEIPLLQFGPFGKKPLLSLKKYYLTCSICGHDAKELTKDQANAMKG